MSGIAFGASATASGAQWCGGACLARFKTDTTYFAQGLRVSSLAIRDGKIPPCGVLARARMGAVGIRETTSSAGPSYFAKASALTSFEIEAAGSPRLASDTAPSGAVGMSGAELKAQDTTYFAQGLRITSLAIENGSWRPSGVRERRAVVRWAVVRRLCRSGPDLLHPGLRITSLVIEREIRAGGSRAPHAVVTRGVALSTSRTEIRLLRPRLRIACLELQGTRSGLPYP